MTKIYTYNEYPEKSLLSKDFGVIDYSDSYMITDNTDTSIDKIAARLLLKGPSWADNLMKIRDFIAEPFGLKTGKHDKPNETTDYYPIGSKLGLFTVINRNDNEIVMGEDDKHLTFRTSVMKRGTENGVEIYLSTIVKYNNIWGKFYFLPVKPFHQVIIKSLLKGYRLDA